MMYVVIVPFGCRVTAVEQGGGEKARGKRVGQSWRFSWCLVILILGDRDRDRGVR
jgi:hypothetical protein